MPGAKSATREGTFFTHQYLWSDLNEIIELLEEESPPHRGLITAGLLLTYTCFEAHLNYLGQMLFPDIWRDSRSAFSRRPYKGTLGKLDFLAKGLDLTIDRGRTPYTTLRQLQQRRNKIVHAHTEVRSHRLTFTDSRQLQPIESEYSRLVTPGFVLTARAAVEQAADYLQVAGNRRDRRLGPKAFSGFLSVRGITIHS